MIDWNTCRTENANMSLQPVEWCLRGKMLKLAEKYLRKNNMEIGKCFAETHNNE